MRRPRRCAAGQLADHMAEHSAQPTDFTRSCGTGASAPTTPAMTGGSDKARKFEGQPRRRPEYSSNDGAPSPVENRALPHVHWSRQPVPGPDRDPAGRDETLRAIHEPHQPPTSHRHCPPQPSDRTARHGRGRSPPPGRCRAGIEMVETAPTTSGHIAEHKAQHVDGMGAQIQQGPPAPPCRIHGAMNAAASDRRRNRIETGPKSAPAGPGSPASMRDLISASAGMGDS